MNPAAQRFQYTRMRRVRTGAAMATAASSSKSRLSESEAITASLEASGLIDGPSQAPPLVISGMVANDATTVTGVSGASSGPLQLGSASLEAAPDVPVVLDRRSRPRNGRSVRVLNVAIAGLLLVLLAPVMLLIAIAVRLTSKGPVIYKQVRVGRDRRHYNVLSPAERRAMDDRRAAALRAQAVGRGAGRSATERASAARTARDRARQSNEERRLYETAVALERQKGRGPERRASQASAAVAAEGGAAGVAAGEARRRKIANAVHDRRTWNTCGETFTMFKFRTMRVDAESGTGAVWAQKKDPRVTPIGGFLRKCRLDELPQLINVLKGDMNIVGPRPERPTIIPDLVQRIAHYPIRQRTRPGITGLAQIRHAYDSSIDDVKAKVRYDLEYLRTRSVMKDLRIMVQTPLVMFFKRSGH